MIKDVLRKLDNKFFVKTLSQDELQLSYSSHIMFNAYPHLNKFIPRELAAYLQTCNEWDLRKFCYNHVGGCIVEPDMGWAVTKRWEVIPYSNIYRFEKSRPLPLYSKYLFRKDEIELDRIAHLNYSWNNYGHFMNDIIGQMSLLDDLNISDVHLVVPEGILNKAYFQGFLELSTKFREKKWFFQKPRTFIQSNDAFFLNTWWSNRANFDAAIDLIDMEVLERNNLNGNNKIFVGRKHARRIINIESILPVLDKYDFTYIEVEDKTLEEQIRIFSNASHVIGIHGAALTNIIFRRNQPLKLIDLYPDCYLDPFYYWICVQYGYEYAAMLCQSINKKGEVVRPETKAINSGESELYDIYVDPSALEKLINEFI